MQKIENWGNLPAGVRQHLIDRMRDRASGHGKFPKTFLVRGQAAKGQAL